MCGRFTLSIPTFPQLAELLGVTAQPEHLNSYRPRYNIAPSDSHWILAAQDDEKGLQPARWGLRPAWMKDEKHPGFINARVETAREKPAFREAFRFRRCLVPADGFYEWTGIPGGKRAFWFSPREKPLFLFAGLFEWSPPRKQDRSGRERSFTILTTRANSMMAPVHNRMPVILSRSCAEIWLQETGLSASEFSSDFRRCLEPIVDDDLELRAVSDYVNSTKNDDPDCIEPLKKEREPNE